MAIPEFISREIATVNACQEAAQKAANDVWAASGLVGKVTVTVTKRRDVVEGGECRKNRQGHRIVIQKGFNAIGSDRFFCEFCGHRFFSTKGEDQ